MLPPDSPCRRALSNASIVSKRVFSYSSFFSALKRTSSIFSFGTTTTPSSSPIIRSPGMTDTPPQEIGLCNSPGPSLGDHLE